MEEIKVSCPHPISLKSYSRNHKELSPEFEAARNNSSDLHRRRLHLGSRFDKTCTAFGFGLGSKEVDTLRKVLCPREARRLMSLTFRSKYSRSFFSWR